jgi:c(7)-type cytochrome triheme protein
LNRQDRQGRQGLRRGRGAACTFATGAALAVLVGTATGDQGESGASRELTADGFDHVAHDARVTARAAKPPPCGRCHTTGAGGRLVGAPGHAACFGDCHGPPPPRAVAAAKVCRACHRPADLARGARARGAVDFPPYSRDPDFALTMSHAAHGRVARACSACHGAPPEPRRADAARARRAPHARCAACHDRKPAPGGVTMAACGTCHAATKPTPGAARAPRRTAGAYPVRSTFSHRRHQARGAGACRTCHAGVVAATGLDVPTPDKQHCRSCHDGKRAFSMIEPSCRRCHGPPQRETPVPLRPRARFSHRAHQEARPNLGCRSCHALDRAGAPITILRGHAPCSSSGCHQDDFADPSPITCSVCHVRSEPWRSQHADPTPADVTEFGAVFSHRKHLAAAPKQRAPCARCHRPARDGRFRPRPGHTACDGEACHGPTRGGAKPALDECKGCHQLGLVAARAAAQSSRPWSVRERFTHAPHAVEPGDRDRPVPCTDCHAGAASSERLADMPSPRKQSCARCHDGRAAFKLTGHTCSRCHTTPAGARP